MGSSHYPYGNAQAGPSRYPGAADMSLPLATQAPANSQGPRRRPNTERDLDEDVWDPTQTQSQQLQPLRSTLPSNLAEGKHFSLVVNSNGSTGSRSRSPPSSSAIHATQESRRRSSSIVGEMDANDPKDIEQVLRPTASRPVVSISNGSGSSQRAADVVSMDVDESLTTGSFRPEDSSGDALRQPHQANGRDNRFIDAFSGTSSTDRNGNGEVEIMPWDEDLSPQALQSRAISKGIKDVDAYQLVKPSYGTGYVYDTDMMLHFDILNATHPECPARIARIINVLHASGCIDRMKRIRSREVTMAEVKLVHAESVWNECEALSTMLYEELQDLTFRVGERDSLYFNESTSLSARLACGSVLELCDAVAQGRIRNGFAVVRPPGHHAESLRSMGFCFYNNAAVAAKWLQNKYSEETSTTKAIKKILIVDWDVHHGNGTQNIVYDDPTIMYISIHRYENATFYPASTEGSMRRTGGPNAPGTNVNIPWDRKAMGDAEYLHSFQQVIMPIAHEFAPDFVLVSAGFDAAEGDHLGENLVTTKGYAHMTQMLDGLANGRLVVTLEGGYNIDAIAKSALAVTQVILGDPAPAYAENALQCALDAAETVRQVAVVQSQFWKCFPKSTLDPLPTDVEANLADDSEGLSGLTATPLPDLIRDHRQRILRKKHAFSVFDVEDMAAFNGLTLVGPADFCFRLPPYQTIMFFVHELGNLRVERSLHHADPHVELAYVLDSSFGLVDWARRPECDFGVVDVSLLGKFKTSKTDTFGGRLKQSVFETDITPEKRAEELDKYVFFMWDNLVGLSDAQNVVLVGQGSGCDAIMKIIKERAFIQTRVKAVIMAMGHGRIPVLPAGELPLKKWYGRVSKVILPHDHPYYTVEEQVPAGKRLGKVERSIETHSVRVLSTALPSIRAFVEGKLGLSQQSSGHVSSKAVPQSTILPSTQVVA